MNINPTLSAQIKNQPLFIQSLARSLYHETTLVRWPKRAVLCYPGMTVQGRIGINENDPLGVVDKMPPVERVLPFAEHDQFNELVIAEDPGKGPWAYAVATFKIAGGEIPQAPTGTDPWKLLNLYENVIVAGVDDMDAAEQAALLYTQSACWVAVHPVVFQLHRDYPVLLEVLRARVFTMSPTNHDGVAPADSLNRFDPEAKFAPGRNHDNCGFVV